MGRDPEQPFALIVGSNEPPQPWDRGDPSRTRHTSESALFVDTQRPER